jgi:hypothetical protein
MITLSPHADRQLASGRRLRRLHRYTFAPNGWFETVARPGTGLWGTQFLTVGCPDDFYAVRLGFPNITTSPYTVPRIVVCPSTSWNDFANPTGGASPIALTTVHGGADSDRIVTSSEVPCSLTVRPNAADSTSGETTIPAWSWTDWCNVVGVRPDEKTGMRVLMIRYTVNNNEGQPVTFSNGQLKGWNATPFAAGGYFYFCGGLNNGSDRTDFQAVNPESLPANTLVNGSFVCAVQFLTKNPAIVGMTTGDSHHQGTTTAGEFSGYMAQVTTSLGKETIGSVPMGWANCAVGGAISQQFFRFLDALINYVHPSYVVLPGWTANESNRDLRADQVCCDRFFAGLLQAADMVRLNGAVPLLLTPFPRNPSFMTADRLAPWRALRQSILGLQKAGEIVADATAVLGNMTAGDFDGTYLPAMTSDQLHPNDNGHAAVAKLLRPMIKSLAEI